MTKLAYSKTLPLTRGHNVIELTLAPRQRAALADDQDVVSGLLLVAQRYQELVREAVEIMEAEPLLASRSLEMAAHILEVGAVVNEAIVASAAIARAS